MLKLPPLRCVDLYRNGIIFRPEIGTCVFLRLTEENAQEFVERCPADVLAEVQHHADHCPADDDDKGWSEAIWIGPVIYKSSMTDEDIQKHEAERDRQYREAVRIFRAVVSQNNGATSRNAEVSIHPEQPNDSAEIRAVVEAAFSSSPLGHHGEANLVERLRLACPEVLSLVAKHDGHVVGHVLFSPVVIEGDSLCGMGLGPMAVLPAFQRRGIGTLLIRRGIENLAERGCSFVCVFGWPDYYGRFGFQSAQQFGLDSEFGGAADDTFQILWLTDHPKSLQGVVRYRPEFSALGHE